MKSEMAIHTIRTGYDNYTYVVTDGAECVVVDASDSASVFDFIEIHCLSLRAIFSTHHHSDHTSGNAELKERTGCVVYGPDQKTLSVDVVVAGNMNYDNVLPGLNVMPVPGHTKTAVAYHLISPAAVFTGDTLFCAGCGRLFECPADVMYGSLIRLAALSENTLVYCGHEYTRENCTFALTVEPSNKALHARSAEVEMLYNTGKPSVPSTIGLEKMTNPFLRVESKEIRDKLGMSGRSPVAVFAELRKRKDAF